MSPITSHIEIARPAEDVFAYATDPSRFSEWQDDVVSARIEAGQAPDVGSRFTTIRRIGRTPAARYRIPRRRQSLGMGGDGNRPLGRARCGCAR
jgi:hypothetical protein